MAIITYNSNTNILDADGGTVADPIVLEDLYDADQAEGWGVFHRLGTGIYFSTAILRFGSNATTYVALDGPIVLTVDAQGTYVDPVRFWNNCHVEGTRAYLCVLNPSGWKSFDLRGTAEFERCAFDGDVDSRSPQQYRLCLFGNEARRGGFELCTIGRSVSEEFDPGSHGNTYIERRDPLGAGETVEEYGGRLLGFLRFRHTGTNCIWTDALGFPEHVDGFGTGDTRWARFDFTAMPVVLDAEGQPVEGAQVTWTDDDGAEQADYTTESDGLPDDDVALPSRQYDDPGTHLDPFSISEFSPYTLRVEWPDGVVVEAQVTVDRPIYGAIAHPDAPAAGDVRAGVEYAYGSREGTMLPHSLFTTVTVEPVPEVIVTVEPLPEIVLTVEK